ncbi:RDD family protein [[Mycoplasma] falconis]|uniref:RDD family protein n=1 Tax=[Mycoplasma] falconis TaxID=92403 RepID=A0A501XB73_9BACT|nr:RDD family protein [[Mycoplasma] falconis]TPE57772.1 RDD family protein [[Mycoplasma] falconis]
MKKINKLANFWIRLTSTLIDLIIFLGLAIGFSFLVFDYKNANYYNKYTYYPWVIFMAFLPILLWVIIPIIWKGKTFGMFICRIKTIPEDSKKKLSKAIFDRQRLFAFFWMFVFLSYLIISPEGFLHAASGQKLNYGEKIAFGLPTTLASLTSFMQLFIIITNAKSTRIGWNDKFSQTYTVWINKYELVENPDEDIKNIIKPIKRELPIIKFEN